MQRSSDWILASLKRGYSLYGFNAQILRRLIVRPDSSVTSDCIIVDPGETVADFEDTMNLSHEIGFDYSFN